ncbi:MAG: hypothetical protein ACLSTO_06415 [Bilophila wadsworthia]
MLVFSASRSVASVSSSSSACDPHLFFALGSQLRDTVGQARFQLGRS